MAAAIQSFIALPRATKYISIALICMSIIAGVRRYLASPLSSDGQLTFAHLVSWLNIVPSLFIWSPWTLLTAVFVESNVIALVLSLFSIYMAARWLEQQWGTREFIKFFLVVTIGSNAAILVLYYIIFVISRDSSTFLFGRINGMNALHEAMLVALMQMIPEHRVQFFAGCISFRVKHLPMVFVLSAFIFLFFTRSSSLFLIISGWIIGWVYLRFFKVTDGIKGDRSETFAFASFFPPFMQGPISKMSNVVYDAFTNLGLCPSRGYDALSTYGGNLPLPVQSRAEAERRRAMALAALDTRLARKRDPSLNSKGPLDNESVVIDMGNNISNGGISSSGPVKPVTTQPAAPSVIFEVPDQEKEENHEQESKLE